MTITARQLHTAGQEAVGGRETWDFANHPLWIAVAQTAIHDLGETAMRNVAVSVLISIARGHFTNPRMYYHNWQHVQDMMAGYRMLYGEPDAEAALAIAWHDAVYVVGAPTDMNETLSFLAFESAIRHEFGESQYEAPDARCTTVAGINIGTVREHILATRMKHHLDFHCDPVLRSSERIIDADLNAFARPYDEFMRTQDNVLLEIKGAPVLAKPDNLRTFRGAQAQFLGNFVADNRPFIYRTHEARELWEDNAQRNIRRFVDEWGV